MSFESRRHSGWYETPWLLRLLGFKKFRRPASKWEDSIMGWVYDDL